MSGNKLLLATLVLAALLAVTVFSFNHREQEDKGTTSASVTLPKIKKEDVDELSIARPEKPAVVLKKVDGKWQLLEPLKAAADSAAVDTALAKLAELEVVGIAATQAENHERLEVTEAKAVHVIAKQAGKPLVDLLIGAYRSGNTMARDPSQASVAVVKGSVKYAFEKETKDWRDRAIAEVTSEQVKEITFDNKGGKFRFVKEGAEWKQAPGDKVLPTFESGKIVSLVGTATTARANDFAAADVTAEAAGVGAKPDGFVTLATGGDAGEQQILLRVGHKQGDGYYLKRDDKEPIFVVSQFAGERMLSGPDKFVKEEAKPGDAKQGAKAEVVTPVKHAVH